MLITLFREMFAARREIPTPMQISAAKRVLNVGGGSKATPISPHFDDWQHDLLDIDPRGAPDIVCDARELATLDGKIYDAIYCSHNLEHYYRHDALQVLRGFAHMLNETGFAEIRVPDIAQVLRAVHEQALDFDDVLYQSAVGPISAHDVIYGLQSEIVSSGQDFYAHKTGFTPKSLIDILQIGGFNTVYLVNDEHLAVHAYAFKSQPTQEQKKLLRLTDVN